MLRKVFIFILTVCPSVLAKRRHDSDSGSNELGGELITALRNDANLDLSMDEEYEDLRAELLAYHTVLASLAGGKADVPAELLGDDSTSSDTDTSAAPSTISPPAARRSLKSTPCWKMGGICVNLNMCKGHRFLTEIPGCKDKLEVCCFSWNKYEAKDLTDRGIPNIAMPWRSLKQEFGGKGLISSGDPMGKEDDRDKAKEKDDKDGKSDGTDINEMSDDKDKDESDVKDIDQKSDDTDIKEMSDDKDKDESDVKDIDQKSDDTDIKEMSDDKNKDESDIKDIDQKSGGTEAEEVENDKNVSSVDNPTDGKELAESSASAEIARSKKKHKNKARRNRFTPKPKLVVILGSNKK